MLSLLLLPLAILWALPATLIGLIVGLFGLATGGRVIRTGRVIEFWGGGAAWFLQRFPLIAGAAAVTFGHTVLAQTKHDLERTREHELIHVAQYERWGPFFLPAYLACYFWLWLCARDPYLDNPFEVEAFNKAGF